MSFDADTIKTAISAGAMLVSLVSLGIMLQSRRAARVEAFKDRLDLAVLELLNNENLISSMGLRVQILLERLQQLSTYHPTFMETDVASRIGDLEFMQEQTEVLKRSLGSREVLKNCSFNKEGEDQLRSVLLSAKETSAKIQNAGFDAVFEQVHYLIKKLDEHSKENASKRW